jgi:hypothetical protein
MKTIDLIMVLAKLPPDLDVVFDTTPEGAEEFRFEVIETASTIMTNEGDRFILLNLKVDDNENI